MAAASEQQWRDFWRQLDAKGDASPIWRQLYTAYTEPWRAYHNLDHIGHCLAEFDRVRQLAHDANAVEAAIWFHDVVYEGMPYYFVSENKTLQKLNHNQKERCKKSNRKITTNHFTLSQVRRS